MKPSLINVPNDFDTKVRRGPLYYRYHSSTGGVMYLPSSVLLLFCDLNYAKVSDIKIRADGAVVIKDCMVPELDQGSCKTVTEMMDFAEVERRLKSAAVPFDYAFDRDLRAFLVNSHRVGEPTEDRIPQFALPVLVEEDGWSVLGRWEVFSAAKELGSRKISIIPHQRRTIVLPTVRTDRPALQEGCIYINYNGTEGNYYDDPVTGLPKIFSRFPTYSYQDVYTMPELPPVPQLDGNAAIVTNGYDMAALEQWFFEYCGQRARKTEAEANLLLGEEVSDPEKLLAFLNAYPDERRFFLYREFLIRKEASPGMLWSLFREYPAFAQTMGQEERFYLSEKQVVEALLECYRVNYSRFYDQIVLTGGNTIAIGDVQQTPYGPMFGIHVIMNAISTLATGNLLRTTADTGFLDPAILLALCLLAGIVYAFTNARFMWVLFLLAMGGIYAAVHGAFEHHNLIISTTPLLFGNGFTFLGVMVWKMMTEERDKRFLHKTFGAYLAPEVISEMYKKQGSKWPEIVHQMQMRIGINHGDIVVGNMGSALRMNYTMMGDAVNVAARLEAACKQYGLYTLVSEAVLKDWFTDTDGKRRQPSDFIASRYIDRVVVVGRTEPVTVFEPIAMKSALSDSDKTLIEIFHRAMAHYTAMEWDQAIELFSESLKFERYQDAGINPSLLFIKRCTSFKRQPPVLEDGKWDGVYRLTKK